MTARGRHPVHCHAGRRACKTLLLVLVATLPCDDAYGDTKNDVRTKLDHRRGKDDLPQILLLGISLGNSVVTITYLNTFLGFKGI